MVPSVFPTAAEDHPKGCRNGGRTPSAPNCRLPALINPGLTPADIRRAFPAVDSCDKKVDNSSVPSLSPLEISSRVVHFSKDGRRSGLGAFMKAKQLKFGIGIGVILAVVGWLAVSGFEQNKTYYVTVSELLNGKGGHEHVRVGGVVTPGSVERHGGQVTFRLSQDAATVPVSYVGSDTLPDTFVGGAQAIIEGTYSPNGVFQADKIQAKCASKYQAAPPGPQSKVARNAG